MGRPRRQINTYYQLLSLPASWIAAVLVGRVWLDVFGNDNLFVRCRVRSVGREIVRTIVVPIAVRDAEAASVFIGVRRVGAFDVPIVGLFAHMDPVPLSEF